MSNKLTKGMFYFSNRLQEVEATKEVEIGKLKNKSDKLTQDLTQCNEVGKICNNVNKMSIILKNVYMYECIFCIFLQN